MYSYTIIIPHKNIPKLLQRCLDSIPHRDDLHIIVVDDNSDPDKVDFEHFPGYDRDDVEIIFTKEGKGAGYARNVGLSHAQGEKIIFADSDDFFNYCINDILNEYKDDNPDIVYFKSTSIDSTFYTNYNRKNFQHELNEYIDLFDSKPEEALMHLRYDYGVPWGKIIRHDVIKENNIKFDETPIHNDTTFVYTLGYYAKNIKVDKRALYCYTFSTSSTVNHLTEEKMLVRVKVFAKREKFYVQNNIPADNLDALANTLISIKQDWGEDVQEKAYKILAEENISKDYIQKKMKTIERKKYKYNKQQRIKYFLKRFLKM